MIHNPRKKNQRIQREYPRMSKQNPTSSSHLGNLNVIFLFCREINGEKKNFCLVTNPRKKLRYSMFSEAES